MKNLFRVIKLKLKSLFASPNKILKSLPISAPKLDRAMIIDLSSKIYGSQNFYWYEALRLPQWDIHCFPQTAEHMDQMEIMAGKLEKIRIILGGEPLKITSWYRPGAYNKKIRGATNSYHMRGMAVDFVPDRMSANKAKILIKDYLEELDLRMEDNGKGRWIHLDLGKPGKTGRFFKP